MGGDRGATDSDGKARDCRCFYPIGAADAAVRLVVMTRSVLLDDLRSRAEQIAEEEREREKKRSLQLAEQRSDLNPPEHRIRAWEQAHGLRMPLDPEHPVLDVIAVSTRLTLSQVQEEQRVRAMRNAERSQE